MNFLQGWPFYDVTASEDECMPEHRFDSYVVEPAESLDSKKGFANSDYNSRIVA